MSGGRDSQLTAYNAGLRSYKLYGSSASRPKMMFILPFINNSEIRTRLLRRRRVTYDSAGDGRGRVEAEHCTKEEHRGDVMPRGLADVCGVSYLNATC